jgi:hypothetical protein
MQLIIATDIAEDVLSEISGADAGERMQVFSRHCTSDGWWTSDCTISFDKGPVLFLFLLRATSLLYSGPIFRSTSGGSNPEVSQKGQRSP